MTTPPDITPSETEPPAPVGHAVIQGYLKTLDASPGVYRMLDRESRVLYVGKARNLRARVSNYARPSGHSARIERMISMTASMMFLTTRTETEALLLEQNLIKQLKPKFNVLLRDDKSFPNILVTHTHAYPQIKKHRGAKKEKGAYYGPFASAGAVNRTLNQLQRVFLLRNCTDSQFSTRTRPCLQYQIKRCSGPCVGLISEADYAQTVKDAERFLSGRSTDIQAELAAQMQAASEAMEFERAAALRDRIRAMTQVQTAQGINPRNVDEADIVALHMEQGQACVQVFFIRAGQNWGNRDFYPRVGADVDAAEVLEAFLGQFYDTKEPPRQLILSNEIENPDLMADALTQKLGRKVELLVPQRGEKAELIDSALRNARESLARKMFLVLGLIGLPLGASLLVDNATIIAKTYGVSDTVIGLTLVAIGTSLPELATTVMAALRRQADVALGNVIGSNMFNLLAIIGIASFVGPIPVDPEFLYFDLWVMLAASVLLVPFVYMRRDITRIWGVVLSALYVGYLAVVLI